MSDTAAVGLPDSALDAIRRGRVAADCAATRALLVGFQDQDNLGLRYLKAAAVRAGFSVDIVTYDANPTPLVEIVNRQKPALVGLSLIFQYMAPQFGRVIQALRDSGVTSHITIGGHYPSFDYEEVLRRIPGLDSVVRFEGEVTLVDLLQRLQSGQNWRDIPGIAFRNGQEICCTPLRRPVSDLDVLPPPDRTDIDYTSADLPTASVLGSRGCPWNCSFCSIRPFYEAQGGSLRRLRKPDEIVQEMAALHKERGVIAFLFQDDDFLATGPRARRWALTISEGLRQAGLAGRTVFKVSCRSDEIRTETIAGLIEGGLTHVYMGVESGDADGLLSMNKKIKPEQHLRAGKILKALDLSFDFGFMLLDPYSTFQSVRNNIGFLEEFVGDGWTVAQFCRMLPYSGTPVKSDLEASGRLLGTPFEPDYRFLDPRLDAFYAWMLKTFHERNFTNTGLSHVLRCLMFEARLKLLDRVGFSTAERKALEHYTAMCNGIAFYALRRAIDHFERLRPADIHLKSNFLEDLTAYEHEEEQRLLVDILELYRSVLAKQDASRHRIDGPLHQGGFRNSWTLSKIPGTH